MKIITEKQKIISKLKNENDYKKEKEYFNKEKKKKSPFWKKRISKLRQNENPYWKKRNFKNQWTKKCKSLLNRKRIFYKSKNISNS